MFGRFSIGPGRPGRPKPRASRPLASPRGGPPPGAAGPIVAEEGGGILELGPPGPEAPEPPVTMPNRCSRSRTRSCSRTLSERPREAIPSRGGGGPSRWVRIFSIS